MREIAGRRPTAVWTVAPKHETTFAFIPQFLIVISFSSIWQQFVFFVKHNDFMHSSDAPHFRVLICLVDFLLTSTKLNTA